MTSVTETDVREALHEVIDPELGVDVVNLGLVYRVEVAGDMVRVVMTMTSPACPLGTFLAETIQTIVKRRVNGVRDVEVVLVWDPPWRPEMMSEQAKAQLDEGWGADVQEDR
jgi:metal-sulfur cluster biosynthetic enzyme